MRSRSLLAPYLVLALAGCSASASGSAAFSVHYPDNQPAALSTALANVHASPSSSPGTTVLATSADGAHLLGVDVTTGAIRYRLDGTSNVPTVVAGDVALIEQGDRLRIVDVATGRERDHVQLARGGETYNLIGASTDGRTTAIGLTAGNGTAAHSRLVLLRDGEVHEDIALDRAIGYPAVTGDSVFVPWGYQFLSVLDARGREHARIRLRSGVVDHALAANGTVWFGGATLHRLSVESATETPAGYTPPNLGIDRAPSLLPGAYEQPAPITSAAYHVRTVFGVDPAREDALPADGTLYLVYYRFVFALDAVDGKPRWVRTLPSDVVGATAFVGGMRVACESGDVVTLSAADGRIVTQGRVGESLRYVAFPRQSQVALEPSSEAPRADVLGQLVEAVQVPDARLVTAREFALSRIAALEGNDATGDLGLLCEDTRLPERTRRKACDLLAGRSVGREYVLTQLDRHGSFLDERSHPPVAALATAAAGVHAVDAAPLLVGQLEDPRTPVTAIAPIADALVALEANGAAPNLLAFLRVYHVNTDEEGMTDALGHVAAAYLHLGGPEASGEVRTLADDPLTPAPLARQLRDAIERDRVARAPQAAPTQAATPTPATPAPVLPDNLTHDLAEPVLGSVHAQLVSCLSQHPDHPGSARVTLSVARDGQVEAVHTTPQSVEPCMREAFRSVRFPATRGRGSIRLPFTVMLR